MAKFKYLLTSPKCALGKDIIQGIQETTQNLQTGIGSFIEKNLPPFSSAYKENNCLKKFENCEQPYSFIHKVFIEFNKLFNNSSVDPIFLLL